MAKQPASYWKRRAAAYARQAGVPVPIFLAQIKQESGFDPTQKSPAGAIGIAQIVPKWHPGVDPRDPEASLAYAARYMAGLHKKYGNYQDALSVYNSGKPWAEGQHIGETRNYVHSILNGRHDAGSSSAGQPAGGMEAGDGQDFRQAVAMGLLGNAQANAAGQRQPFNVLQLAMLRQQQEAAQDAFGAPSRNTRVTGHVNGNLDELFYDPMGGWKHGKQIGAIGGHSDHVHMADDNPQNVLRAISWAQSHGLHVSENPYVGGVAPVHVTDSYHYRTFGGKYKGKRLGEAIDVSGSPAQMAAFARWALKNR